MNFNQQMTVGSLFTGFGGIDYGLEKAGMRTAWMVEKDDFRRERLAREFPNATIYGDINDLDLATLPPVDVIAGGFPCQPHSLAGKRAGTADDRYLWPRMLEVIQALRPTWVIGENVDGLRSMVFKRMPTRVVSRRVTRTADRDHYSGIYVHKEHMLLERICQDIEGIDYEVQPIVIPAAGVNAPHLRYRIFIVAHAKQAGVPHEGRRSPGAAQGEMQAGGEQREWIRAHAGKRRDPGPVEDSEQAGRLRDIQPQGKKADWQEANGPAGDACGRSGSDSLADAGSQGLQSAEQPVQPGQAECGQYTRSTTPQRGRRYDSWDDAAYIVGHDGRARRVPPVESGILPVAHGIPQRKEYVSGYGDGVVPELICRIGLAMRAVEAAGA